MPEFYLRRFADGRDQLSVLDLKSGRVFLTPVDDASVESDFYTVDDTGEPSDAIEKSLGEIEGYAAPGFAALDDSGEWPPSVDVRGRIANFVALQGVRGRGYREFVEGTAERQFRALLRRESENPEGVRRAIREVERREPNNHEIDDMREFMREGRFSMDFSGNLFVREMLQTASEGVQRVADLTWQLYEIDSAVTDAEFFTSDIPLLFWGDFRPPISPDPRKVLSGVEMILPLDRRRALVMRYPSARGEIRRSIGQPVVRDMNRRQAKECHRFLYGHPEASA